MTRDHVIKMPTGHFLDAMGNEVRDVLTAYHVNPDNFRGVQLPLGAQLVSRRSIERAKRQGRATTSEFVAVAS